MTLYKVAGPDATFAAINALDGDNSRHPFVLDLTASEIVADGSDLNREGEMPALLESAAVLREQILADLNENRQTWIGHTVVDPATGKEEPRCTRLVLRFGYNFGSGYDSGPSNPLAFN